VYLHQAEVLIEVIETEIQEGMIETSVIQAAAVIEIEVIAVVIETAIVETKIAAAATRTERPIEAGMTENPLTDHIQEKDLREREVHHRTLFTKRKELVGIRCPQVSRSSLSQQSSSLLSAQYLTTSTHKLNNKSDFISATFQLKFRMTS